MGLRFLESIYVQYFDCVTVWVVCGCCAVYVSRCLLVRSDIERNFSNMHVQCRRLWDTGDDDIHKFYHEMKTQLTESGEKLEIGFL